MKKFLLLAAVVALVAATLALPAMAQRNNGNNGGNDRFGNNGFFDRFDNFDRNDFFDFFDNRFDNNNGNNNQPAVSQEIGQEAQSGDANIGFSVSSSGDYAQQCVAPLQFANTGNLQNAQGFVQYNSTDDDVDFQGSAFGFAPSVQTTCNQAVQQSAAASSN